MIIKINGVPLDFPVQPINSPMGDLQQMFDSVLSVPVPTEIIYDKAHTAGAFVVNSLKEFDYAAYHFLKHLPGGEFGYQLAGKVADGLLGGLFS